MEVRKKKKKVVVLCSRFPQKVQRRQRNFLCVCVLVAVAVFVAEAP